MTRDGMLVVYDHDFGRRSADSDEIEAWYRAHIARWPRPATGRRGIDPTMLARGSLELVTADTFTVELTLDLDAYVDYAMTETNVAFALRAGTPEAEIRSACIARLTPAFSAPQRIQFDGYFACLALSADSDDG